MNVSIREMQEMAICDLEGHIIGGTDHFKMKQFLQNLQERKYRKIILNFQKVQFIDSDSIGTLILFKKKVEAQQVRVAICSFSKDIRDLFSMIHVNELYPVCDSETEAIQAVCQERLPE